MAYSWRRDWRLLPNRPLNLPTQKPISRLQWLARIVISPVLRQSFARQRTLVWICPKGRVETASQTV